LNGAKVSGHATYKNIIGLQYIADANVGEQERIAAGKLARFNPGARQTVLCAFAGRAGKIHSRAAGKG
jgi:urease beta subunit